MKKIITLLALSAMTAGAQFQTLDTTTLRTVPTTNTALITITNTTPGTNLVYKAVNTNNTTLGDSVLAGWTKINANFAAVLNYMHTNSPYAGLSNFWLDGVVDGRSTSNNFTAKGAASIKTIVNQYLITNPITGGGGTSNAIPIYNGGGTNLTVTNTLTLRSTTPWYSVIIWNPTNLPPDDSGVVCSNRNGPYYPAPTVGAGALTNACGYVAYIGDMTTNSSDLVGYITVGGSTNAGVFSAIGYLQRIFTSSQKTNMIFDVAGANISAANGRYYYSPTVGGVTPPAPIIVGTNASTYYVSYQNGYSGLYSLAVLDVANNPLYQETNSFYTPKLAGVTYQTAVILGSAPAPTMVFNYALLPGSTGTTNRWATYETNAWRFYSATNVAFSNEVAIVTGTTVNLLYVTNVTQWPLDGFPYIANSGDTVLFTITNMMFPVPVFPIVIQDGVTYYGSVDGSGPPIVVGGGGTNTPPTTSTNPPPPWVPPYVPAILYTLNGVTKSLAGGVRMWSDVNSLNRQAGTNTSSLTVDVNGTAKEVLLGRTIVTVPWTSSQWSTSIPPYAFNVLGLTQAPSRYQ